jgi:hypothetical protein
MQLNSFVTFARGNDNSQPLLKLPNLI